jgi:hypothetical protein
VSAFELVHGLKSGGKLWALKGLKFERTYVIKKGWAGFITVKNLTRGGANVESFERKDELGAITKTMVQHDYLQQFNVTLQFLMEPCAVTAKGDFIPLELLCVAADQQLCRKISSAKLCKQNQGGCSHAHNQDNDL